MQVSPSFRIVLAVTLVTVIVCLAGVRAERTLTKRPAANETELSVDASGSLTAEHTEQR